MNIQIKRGIAILPAAAALIAASTVLAQETSQTRAAVESANLTVPLSEIPAAVRETLRAEVGETSLAEHEHNPEEGFYLFRTAGGDGQRLFLIMRENGDLRTRSRETIGDSGSLSIDFLPAAARKTIADALAETSGRVVEATEDLHDGAVVGYEAEIAYADDQIRWFAFAPDGRTREVREETAWNAASD